MRRRRRRGRGRVGDSGGGEEVGGLRRGGGQHGLDELMRAVLLGLDDAVLLVAVAVRVGRQRRTGRLHTAQHRIVEGDLRGAWRERAHRKREEDEHERRRRERGEHAEEGEERGSCGVLTMLEGLGSASRREDLEVDDGGVTYGHAWGSSRQHLRRHRAVTIARACCVHAGDIHCHPVSTR